MLDENVLSSSLCFNLKHFILWGMYRIVLSITLLTLVLLGLSGCETKDTGRSEFVQSVEFSRLDTFHYKPVLLTGMDWSESQRDLLERVSETVVMAEMKQRGFESVGDAADFDVVLTWRKAATFSPSPTDHIDGARMLRRRSAVAMSGVSIARVHLTIELRQNAKGYVFWRKELPNIFDAIEVTEDRIIRSIQRGLRNYPDRIVKDPNLKSFE